MKMLTRPLPVFSFAICFIFYLLITTEGYSQDSTKQNPLTISGYVESYYSFDFNRPSSNLRPGFLYNYNRHNEFNLNLGFVKASYNTDRVRANFAIGAGTYMNANYSAEPGVIKNVYEANAGFKLSRKKNLWLDIGILPSHIDFESAIGRDNWTVTRSLVAENSPYFEGGAKLGYTTGNGKWFFSVLALNGWQRVTKVEGNSMLSWGNQVTFKPNAQLTLNYSSFFGTDKPDSARLIRTYHNFYCTIQPGSFLGLTAGFDFGTEERAAPAGGTNTWYTPVAILRLTPSSQWALAVRGEYFNDKNGVIVNSGTPDGFKTVGFSANIDYLPLPNATLRLELRNLNNSDDMFVDRFGKAGRSNTALSVAAAVSF